MKSGEIEERNMQTDEEGNTGRDIEIQALKEVNTEERIELHR